MSLDDLRLTFFQECEELLEQLGDGLEEMSSGTRDNETVNAIFRAVHSIKGGAGAFGLTNLVNFAHTFETMLDQVRSGTLEASDEVVLTSLRSSDILNDLVAIAQTDGDVGVDAVDPMMIELNAHVSGAASDGAPRQRMTPRPSRNPRPPAPPCASTSNGWSASSTSWANWSSIRPSCHSRSTTSTPPPIPRFRPASMNIAN